MKTISIPVNDRPELLAKCLTSIRACPTWREWRIVFSCEPPVREATEQLMIATAGALISRNAVKLGCWENTFHAASVAMAMGSTLNLYLEDDYLITPDTLTLVDQWDASRHDGILCLRRWHGDQQFDKAAIASPASNGLLGCGFAWRSDLWEEVRSGWFHLAQMWDISLAAHLADRHIHQWRPLVNRSHGIGINGTHTLHGGADLNLFGPAYSGEPITRFTFEP